MNPSSPSGVSRQDANTPKTIGAVGWSQAFNCVSCSARVFEERGVVYDYVTATPHTCPHMVDEATRPASPSSETATEAFDTAALRRRAAELDGIDWPGGANGVALIEDAADEIDRLRAALERTDRARLLWRIDDLAIALHRVIMVAGEAGAADPAHPCNVILRIAREAWSSSAATSAASSPPVPAEAPNEDTARVAFVAGFLAKGSLADRTLFADVLLSDAIIQFNLWRAARSTPTEATHD